MAQRSVIVGSERLAPHGAPVGSPDPDQTIDVSVYLKRPIPADGEPTQPASRARVAETRAAALAPQLERLRSFATAHGLRVLSEEPARRLVRLSGRLGDLEAAFGATLQLYEHPQRGPFRARTGSLTAPQDVADITEAVLGLDDRPQATPKSIRLVPAVAGAGRLPSDIARLYDFPKTPGHGRGQCIAIIELGGGVDPDDTAKAFAAMKLAAPQVLAIAVDGAETAAGVDTGADGEVALDVQVAGAAAPGARLAVYFAPNTDQGFVDAITQAAHDTANAPSVMSISWGAPESGWTKQAVAAMTSAFEDAAELGVSVFAASGDSLATDGATDGKAHVDFPASSPWVVGCGGTRLASAASGQEQVWNEGGNGTGGGVSALFKTPAWQANLHLPAASAQKLKGRGVPDVAGDADPQTGYRVVVGGRAQVIGGTSAVAPLWAGLFALVNELAGKPVGQPHAKLYAAPQAFNDVVDGDNRAGKVGYAAAPGWDPCTGLGTPKGTAVAALFTS
jgi:kumamolisin